MLYRIDQEEIKRALTVFIVPGQVTELRALDAVTAADRRPHTFSGYFDDPKKLAKAAAAIESAKGIYFIPNPVKPALLARSVNKARAVGKEPTTSDEHIHRRHWLLIDCDPVRPAGISASDDEHAAALTRAMDIDAWLMEQGWPAGVRADSGNGGHLLFRIDLPCDDGGLVERCLHALEARFSDEQVVVDTTVFNPARIWKLYGTLAGKGDADAAAIGRPQRMAKILNSPAVLEPVSQEKLELLAELVQPDEPDQPVASAAGKSGSFDLEAWIARYGLGVGAPKQWKAGTRWEFDVCPWNPEHTNRSAFIVRHASGALAAGCHHNGCKGRKWHDLRELFEPGHRERQREQSSPRSNSHPRQQNWTTDPPAIYSPKLVILSTVAPKEVQWLWPSRIPLGKLTLIAGEPGLGKSFLSMDMAARISVGKSWPDNPSISTPVGSVVLLSAEDDIADTIRPRLDAAGADCSKIVAIQGVEFVNDKQDKPHERAFNLEQDLPALEQAIRSVQDCRLVVIDPISAFLGGKDSHKNAEIRGMLAPLSDLAAKYSTALVAVTHLNKCSGQKAMHRFTGSLAFIAAARAGWLIAADTENEHRRLMLPVKNNLAENIGGLAYAIVEGALAWETGPVSMSADDALGEDPRRDGHTERDDAADWLRELLADGPLSANDVKEAGKEAGYSWATIRRAKVKVWVTVRKDGFSAGAKWLWCLPGNWGFDAKALINSEDAHPGDVSAFVETERLRPEQGGSVDGGNEAEGGGAHAA